MILPIGSSMIFEKISIVFYIRNEMSVFTFILIFMSKQKLAEYDYVISHTKCDVIRREMVPSYEKNTSKARSSVAFSCAAARSSRLAAKPILLYITRS